MAVISPCHHKPTLYPVSEDMLHGSTEIFQVRAVIAHRLKDSLVYQTLHTHSEWWRGGYAFTHVQLGILIALETIIFARTSEPWGGLFV